MDIKLYDNLAYFVKNGRLGQCPHCGSKKMDLSVQIVDKNDNSGYGVYWCDECKRGIHLSRLVVDERFKPYIKPLPSNIKL